MNATERPAAPTAQLATVSPTRAPAPIGALAASLQALEMLAVLRDDSVAFGEETYVSTRSRRMLVTRFARNPHCRFSHEILAPGTVGPVSVLEAFSLEGAPESTKLSVAGGFATRIRCTGCARDTAVLRAWRAFERAHRACEHCDEELIATGIDLKSSLSLADVPANLRRRPLAVLGLRRGDLFSVGSHATAHYFYDPPRRPCANTEKRGHGSPVVIVGCGNIGSHLVSLVARMPGVASVLLVDPDTYDASNVAGQAFPRRGVGHPKATVQARVLRALNPELEVTALRMSIEDVPLALLRDAVVAACVDSRRARQAVNEAVWHVGRCWIDAAVDGDELLARLIAYRPSDIAPCLECAWGDDDYAALEQVHACERVHASPPQ